MLQRLAIRVDDVAHAVHGVFGADAVGKEVFDGHDQRRVRDDAQLPALIRDELRERLHAVPGAGLRDHGVESLHLLLRGMLLVALALQPRLDLVDIEVVVPGLEHARFGGLQHPLPIAARSGEVVRPALLVGEAAVASGDLHARDQPLDVPLERPGVRLVEVVDVEDEVALGAREQTEVRQVGIAAQLDDQSAAGGVGEVGGHQQCCPSVEREGRDHHATVADGNQIGHSRYRLLFEQRHRVGAILRR